MNKSSFLNALGTLVYIVAVATLLQNGERIFGKMDSLLGPITFLLLFTLSAIVVGTLILGKPIMLYLDGKKKEAIRHFLETIALLACFTAIALIIAFLVK